MKSNEIKKGDAVSLNSDFDFSLDYRFAGNPNLLLLEKGTIGFVKKVDVIDWDSENSSEIFQIQVVFGSTVKIAIWVQPLDITLLKQKDTE